MSNAVMNDHIMLKAELNKYQVYLLRCIGEFLHTENPEQGQREQALEEYFLLWDSVSKKED
jgi:hypothetical protein